MKKHEKQSVITISRITNPTEIEQSAAREVLVESFIHEYSQYLRPDELDGKLNSWRDGPLSVQKYYENYFSSEFKEFSEGKLQYWVEAKIEGKLAGWATFEVEKADKHEVYMNLLIVHPDYQRRGVGRKLVMSLIDFDLITSLSAIHIQLRKKNEAGRLFYQELGFYSDPTYTRPGNYVDMNLIESWTWKNPALMNQERINMPFKFFGYRKSKEIAYKSFENYQCFAILGSNEAEVNPEDASAEPKDRVEFVPVPAIKGDGQPSRFTATLVDCVEPSPCYDDTWFILLRQGEFGAQIEKVAAKLYDFFLGYGTQIDIVKAANSYYVASRKIKNFVEWDRVWNKVTVNHDGLLTLTQGEEQLPIVNFGKIAALTEFFADTDCISSNFGLQAHAGYYRAFKIDNEHTFSFDHESEMEGVASVRNTLTQCQQISDIKYVDSKIFLDEKEAMLIKIAETDFSTIEAMIRAIVTANQIPFTREMLTSFIKSANVDDPNEENSSMDIAFLQEQLKALEAADPADYGVEKIIMILQERHQDLQRKFLKGRLETINL